MRPGDGDISDLVTERDTMRDALRKIKDEMRWVESVGYCVSNHDAIFALRCVRKQLDLIHPLIWPPEPETAQSEPLQPMDDNF